MAHIWKKLSLRGRLILVFIIIKIVPLLLLVWIAWGQSEKVARNLTQQAAQLGNISHDTIQYISNTETSDAVSALDARAREEIERQTTDTAHAIADFLYARDADILYAQTLTPDTASYRKFIENQRRNLVEHGPWKLAEDGKSWQPVSAPREDPSTAQPGSPDNAKDFHYRKPDALHYVSAPLYVEMTFVGLDGKERVKVTTSGRTSATLKDISIRANTYAKAETYFSALKKLKPGEIYVSDVIGSYVGSKIIGAYTPEAAAAKGIAYDPENSAYAGKENPVGKRFQGIIRWATPVTHGGHVIGWVTLALNHDHLMSFTDTIVPTAERYRDINDASEGNYAFIWDYKGRNIVHPRHHSIAGYDPQTGEPAVPWLEAQIYDAWQRSGQSYSEFIKTVPIFDNQSQSKKPAKALTDAGNVGLDCRYLNFAPQCIGWYNLADHGGSGSFLILWSGLWKLTTTAAIPYYTGQYSPQVTGNKRGFGIVTIGANVEDFHRAANESKERTELIVGKANNAMKEQVLSAQKAVAKNMTDTAYGLGFATLTMIAVVIAVAIWMASYLSNRIKWLSAGFNRFRLGDRNFRFDVKETDEITALATSFNGMADTLSDNFNLLKEEISIRSQKENELNEIKENLENLVEERTQRLSEINNQLHGEIEIRRATEAQAKHLAGHDPLTGLANRRHFQERLQETVNQVSRSGGKAAALLFFDLNHFKSINDTHGHAVGDALLIHTAQILSQCARKTDTVARLGGDEFAIIMRNLTRPDDAALFAQKILDRFAEPTTLGGHQLCIHSSIGIATFAGDDLDAEKILTQADMAMYQAKTQPNSCFRFFEESMQKRIQEKKEMETALRAALAQRQFVPYFQPILDASTQRIAGVEALVRWMHPKRGILIPDAFIEIATACDLMKEIDAQMLEMACTQAQKWLEEGTDFGKISVNVLPERIVAPDFIETLEAVLEKTGLPAHCLMLEITERALLSDEPEAVSNLSRLRALGVSIAIDDFGTKYSMLEKLIEYPIDTLKIDGLFVRRIGEDKVESVLHAIFAMARSIGLCLVAEGVESQAQRDFLLQSGCFEMQGYLHAHPMPAEDARQCLRRYADGAASRTS